MEFPKSFRNRKSLKPSQTHQLPRNFPMQQVPVIILYGIKTLLIGDQHCNMTIKKIIINIIHIIVMNTTVDGRNPAQPWMEEATEIWSSGR